MCAAFNTVNFALSLLLNSVILNLNAQPIIGNEKNCNVEGEKIELPGITNNPCITCYCEKGHVQCRAEKCQKLTCHVIRYEEGRCCPECQGCRERNKYLNGSKEWVPNDDASCTLTNCNNGILTHSRLQCIANCQNPAAPPDGECCPSCEGCEVEGALHSEGEVFDSPRDACTKCMCKNGQTVCSRKPCPVVPCGKRQTRISPDGCCLECVGYDQTEASSDGSCLFRHRKLQNRKKIKADKCTKCRCQNGTLVCRRRSCRVRKCPGGEPIYRPNRCCPKCPNEFFQHCLVRKKKHKHNETWTEPENPCIKYQCNNGTVTNVKTNCSSTATTCKPGEILDEVPGKCCKSCVPEPGICTVFGDPHYRTFDGRPFNFQGDCKYILSKDCLEKNFSVVVQNDGKHSRSYSWTKTVFLNLYATQSMPGTLISLHQRLAVKINGKRIFLPHRTPHYVIKNIRGYVELKSVTGVSLRWDGDSYLEVGASPKYRGVLCGLCGNFNSFKRDDVIGGDGLLERNDVEFAESWRATDNIFDCTRPNYDAKIKRPCGTRVSALLRAREKCLVFKSPSFQPCYGIIDPIDYYQSCLTDACECPRSRKCSCESIRAYTEACSREGVGIEWNEKEHCRKTCRHGKVYSSCGPPCRMTCSNYKNSKRNKRCLRRPCTAGCHCPAGQVLFRKRCIRITQCPKRVKINEEKISNYLPRQRFLLRKKRKT